MQSEVTRLGSEVGLQLRAGVGQGALQLIHVGCERGRRARRAAMVRGSAMAEALAALKAAQTAAPGTVVAVSETVHNSNEDQRGLVFSRLADGVQKLSSATPLREAASDFELQLPTPTEFGVMAPRAKAHLGIMPYVRPLSVAFARNPGEFRRCCCVAVLLHGYSIHESSAANVADLNQVFADVYDFFEGSRSTGDGLLLQLGFGSVDNSQGCTALCVLGLGENEDLAAECELRGVRDALRLSEALRQKQCGAELSTHYADATDARPTRYRDQAADHASLFHNRVGSSIGVASGWCFVSGLGHDARHSVACMGQVAEAAQTLMTDDTAHGSVLITEDVEFKVRADFECLSVAPHNMLESTIQRLGTSNVWRAEREASYL